MLLNLLNVAFLIGNSDFVRDYTPAVLHHVSTSPIMYVKFFFQIYILLHCY